MKRPSRKQIYLIAGAVLLLAIIAWGLIPESSTVRTASVERGPLQVILEEEGETQVRDRFVVSATIPAFARRPDIEVGDMVNQGDVLLRLEPPRAVIPDARAHASAVAGLEAATAALNQAREQLRAAETLARQTAQDRDRIARLVVGDAATPRALERAELELEQAEAGVAAARATVEAAGAEQTAARAALQPGDTPQGVQSTVRAPVAGRILALHTQSGGPVNPGEPLVEIGDVSRLEAWVNVLSQDAVRIRPGSRVLLEQWGNDHPLEGSVERIDPQGFVDISSLGVEERRVRVVVGFEAPAEGPDQGLSLGSGYRVLARFIVWEGDEVLQVPTSALFRVADGWAVFVLENDRAVRRSVEVGQQAGLNTEIVRGLSEGEQVVIHPSGDLEDGSRVQVM